MQVPYWLWIILIGVLVSSSCGLIGCFLVLRRMALLGDAISHAVLPGIGIAFLVTRSRGSWPMFVGATILGLLTVLFVQVLNKNGRVRTDAAIGVTFTSLFALGVVLISLFAYHVDLDLDCVLYGDITLAPLYTLSAGGMDIGPRAFWQMAIIFGLCLLVISVFFKELKIAAFDPEMATAVGINATLMHYLLMGLVSVTTVGAFEPVGAILVIAMLTVPPATAYLLTDDLKSMLGISVLFGVLSTVLGFAAAYMWDVSIAGAMSVVAGLLFTVVFLFSPRHGWITRVVTQRRLSRSVAREDALQALWRAHEILSDAPPAPMVQGAVTAGAMDRIPTEAAPPMATTAQTAFKPLDVLGLAALTQTEISLARRALDDLRRDRLVQPSDGGFVLTPAGSRVAQELVHRHRVYETYLGNLGYPDDHIHDAADRIEHYISPQLVETVDAAVGNPTTDPHGKPIPHD